MNVSERPRSILAPFNHEAGHIRYSEADPVEISVARNSGQRPRVSGRIEHVTAWSITHEEAIARAVPIEPHWNCSVQTTGVAEFAVRFAGRNDRDLALRCARDQGCESRNVALIPRAQAQVDYVHSL